MVWELAIFSGNKIETFRRLSNSEVEQYHQSAAFILHFAQDRRIFQFQKSNFDDYGRLLEEYSEDAQLKKIIGKPPTSPEAERVLFEINRHLLNYLSTIRTFLDYSEYNLKRRYGKNSEIFASFKEACRKAYSNCFSYRFIYNLRNCAQHCTFPIALELTSQEVVPYSGKIQNSLIVKLDRDRLLTSGYDWRKMSEKIQSLPEQFDIAVHINEMESCIKKNRQCNCSRSIAASDKERRLYRISI